LAEDGGFTEVRSLYDSSRWVSAAILLLFVVYNVYSVASLDLMLMNNPDTAVLTMDANIDPAKVNSAFYFSRGLVQGVLSNFIGDVHVVSVLGALELAGLLYFCGAILYRLVQVKTCENFTKWFAVQEIIWELLPILSTYSAMKMLNNVAPAVACTKFFYLLNVLQEAQAEDRSTTMAYLGFLQWIILLIFAFVLGFDTFLLKLRVIAAEASAKTLSLSVVIPCIQFLVQLLGIVQLGAFVKARIFLFIFGGEDGVIQDEEEALQEVWESLLAKRMYEDLPLTEFVATVLTFSDEDFQRLVLNESAEKKRAALNHC